MRIAELWRYPVKSMGGEQLDAVEVDQRGVHADRLWAVRDLQLGAVTTARRLPMLLGCSARFVGAPPADAGPGVGAEVLVTFPDGEERSSSDPAVHELLSALTGRRVRLVPLPPVTDRAAYRGPLATQNDLRRQFGIPDDEPLPDLTMFPVRKLAELARYATPVGTFADAYPLHLLSRASLAAMHGHTPGSDFDRRRFRPSILLESDDAPGLVENGWLGGTLTSPETVLRPQIPTIRCSMPAREQPGLEAEPDVVRTVRRQADGCLGVYADVVSGGRLEVGQELTFEPAAEAAPLAAVATRLGDAARRAGLRASNVLMPKGR
ncbi:hypothetical protein DSM112329_02293 [Paraconexibacter sp. AEG42_29]|uniref:MOSC domain-containing protein n=1 Tax=Paraconexibacter sp. AEG42_29 TaxID=2997339 RepID=A0AAU7AVE6_9ACTN